MQVLMIEYGYYMHKINLLLIIKMHWKTGRNALLVVRYEVFLGAQQYFFSVCINTVFPIKIPTFAFVELSRNETRR